MPAAAPGTGTPAPQQEPVATMGENSAEISLPKPTRYAVLLHEARKVRTLHTRGDVLSHPQDPAQSVTIERIEPETILLREGGRTTMRSVRVGTPIPGFRGLHFTETVLLEKIQYRSRSVEHLAHPEPVVVALEGPRAIVEVEVLRTVSSPPPVRPAPSSLAAEPPASEGPPAKFFYQALPLYLGLYQVQFEMRSNPWLTH